MKTLNYVINDALGIHARPAGALVKLASSFKSEIKISAREKNVDAKRIMGVMGLGIKQGDTVTFSFNGEDEDSASVAMQEFLEQNL